MSVFKHISTCLLQFKKINLDSLEIYCNDIGVDVQVVPRGSYLKPPNARSLNLGLNPDLEKEMKMLENLFQIDNSDDPTDGAFQDGAWE